MEEAAGWLDQLGRGAGDTAAGYREAGRECCRTPQLRGTCPAGRGECVTQGGFLSDSAPASKDCLIICLHTVAPPDRVGEQKPNHGGGA